MVKFGSFGEVIFKTTHTPVKLYLGLLASVWSPKKSCEWNLKLKKSKQRSTLIHIGNNPRFEEKVSGVFENIQMYTCNFVNGVYTVT